GWFVRGYRLGPGVRRCRRGRRRWGFWLLRRHGLRVRARSGLLSGGRRRPPAVTGADVLVDEVLNDEQRGRPVVELFAPVRADVEAEPAAALTDALGLGQLVVPG